MDNPEIIYFKISTLRNLLEKFAPAEFFTIFAGVCDFSANGSEISNDNSNQNPELKKIISELKKNISSPARTRNNNNNNINNNNNTRVFSIISSSSKKEENNILNLNSNSELEKNAREKIFQEIRDFAADRAEKTGIAVNVDFFIEYYEATNWRNKYGEPITSWKRAFFGWEKNEMARQRQIQQTAAQKPRREKNTTAEAYEEIINAINAPFFGVSATQQTEVVKNIV